MDKLGLVGNNTTRLIFFRIFFTRLLIFEDKLYIINM